MKKKALVLHCWYGNPNENWYPWIKEKLKEKGYQVFVPELPTMSSELPDMQLQIDRVKDLVDFDKKTLIIGHSLGSLLALRLAEKQKVGKMILVSGWDFNDLTPEHEKFWQKTIDHQKIKENSEEIICITSDNDPYFTPFQIKEMSKRLNGEFVLVEGAGHFTEKDFGVTKIPQLLEYL